MEQLTNSLRFLLPLFLVVYFLIIKLHRKSGGVNLPPSPPKLPIIGNLHQLGRLAHKSLRDLAQKYGPLMFVHFGSTRFLVVSSADAVEKIAKSHDVAFANRHAIEAFRPFVESGQDLVFSHYGDHWRQAKKICVHHLLSQKMVMGFQILREEEISIMLETIRFSSCPKGSAVDLRDMFVSVVSSIVYRSFTGRRCEEKLNGMTFGNWIAKFKRLMEAFCFADLFPYLGWMDKLTGFRARLKSTFAELDGFMDHLIDESNNRSCSEENFVDILLRLQREGKFNYDLTLNDIKAIMQSLFVAATDNVTSLLEWVMAELVKHPDSMKKAQDEVQRVVGSKSKIGSSDTDRMHYLKCVITETMRLHPFGIFPRETKESVKIYGYEVPPETKVMVNLWAIQRDPRVWEDPDEFIPERFTDVQIDFKGHQKGFVPFGFGRRHCPGISYALALVENVIANLLYRFNWELPGGSKPEELSMEEKFQLAILRSQSLRLVPVPRLLTEAEG